MFLKTQHSETWQHSQTQPPLLSNRLPTQLVANWFCVKDFPIKTFCWPDPFACPGHRPRHQLSYTFVDCVLNLRAARGRMTVMGLKSISLHAWILLGQHVGLYNHTKCLCTHASSSTDRFWDGCQLTWICSQVASGDFMLSWGMITMGNLMSITSVRFMRGRTD